MAHFAAVDREEKILLPHPLDSEAMATDPRWQLAHRLVASRHFARSPLLSNFLLHIVAETIANRTSEITEHQIGVQVFDRPATYRTVEDNIVRNYARQLRRRLADYFAEEGAAESLHIDIPLGGYVPVFVPAADPAVRHAPTGGPVPLTLCAEASDAPLPSGGGMLPMSLAFAPDSARRRPLLFALLLGLYSAILMGAVWFAAGRVHAAHTPVPAATEPTSPLWNALFGGSAPTYIVPADAGLNILEDLSRRPIPLADYIDGAYSGTPLPPMDAHSAQDLRSQYFTSFVDLQIISSLSRLPQFNPQRAVMRFPRDLRLDDLRNANGVIIGSVGSNPWAAIAESHANFRIVYREGMQGATIVNAAPERGESATYVSHWNEPAHETFALISWLPNLEGNGHILVLQGLDVAGTQASGDALFHPSAIAPILRRATRPDGSLRSFEILLRSTSIESSATQTEVIGSRIY
ncbi:MAG TPA: hypothetical protein VHZ09_18975 [Acidobacteriaceae bacterium]|jgi:hypothetical protein|nr:hypothetical protein [Acidobacteriaceae bacterium]